MEAEFRRIFPGLLVPWVLPFGAGYEWVHLQKEFVCQNSVVEQDDVLYYKRNGIVDRGGEMQVLGHRKLTSSPCCTGLKENSLLEFLMRSSRALLERHGGLGLVCLPLV